MKKHVFVAALAMMTLLWSCTKENEPIRVNSRDLEGIWELRLSSGGLMPGNPDGFKPGNGNQWRFSRTEYARFFADTLYHKGTYTISNGTGTDPNNGRAINQFIFDQQPAESFELVNDSLRFYYGPIAADGLIQWYVKISDNPGL